VAFGLSNLVGMALGAGDTEQALAAAEESVAMAQRLSDVRSDVLALACAALANARAARGELDLARIALADAERALAQMPEASPRARATLDGLKDALAKRELAK